jgi:peptidoglycan-N-acetylmuramic acid deacetylase
MEETLKKYLWGNKVFGTRIFPTLCFLAAAFLLGRAIAGAVAENRYDTQAATQTSAGTSTVALGTDGTVGTLEQSQTWGLLFTENWGLGFGESGKCPTGNSSAEELKKYNAYFVGDTTDKKIYLTFDCGYENGNTEAILDALKKHNASATFFVVGHYLESAPDLVKRMVAEGHTVGNHTYHHPDMSQISDKAAFQKEMDDVRSLYKEVTGEEMVMYYRPPQGKYSTANLQMAQELGYATFFWSLAYVDWNVDDQPSHEEAFEKLTKRIHPGAIVLLHNTSKTNGEILDELLTKWEKMGYSFGTLEELTSGA